MADYLEVKVAGLAQLQKNLVAFGSEKIAGRIIKASLQSAARVVRPRAASNARALGLGSQGIVRRLPPSGPYKTYGRIPRALKVGKAYKPRGYPDLYRVNVVARGQRGTGIFKNKAPHAHLIEYGFRVHGGGHVAGRAFLGPALDATANQVVEQVAETMRRRIDQTSFPT